MLQLSQLVNTLYPATIQLSNAELVEIAEAFNKPAVKKYLQNLGIQGIRAIAEGQRKEGESAELFLQRQAVVQGELAAVQMLLSIEAPAKQA